MQNASATILDRIRDTIATYKAANGGAMPAAVHLTERDELEFYSLSVLQVGDAFAAEILRGNIRALTKIYGVPIEWNAKAFGVRGPNS